MEDLHSEDMPVQASVAMSRDFRNQVVELLSWDLRAGPKWRRWTLAAAAALIGAMGVWYWISRPDPERLLAQSYSARRTMEIRIPGAQYAPLRATKGSGAMFARDARFIEAELLIVRALDREPGDPKWLQLSSRMDLLRWKYDPAIGTLEQLSASEPDSVSISADLGSAYLLRGIHQQTASDLQKAVESLTQVLRHGREGSELYRVSLFNRAIALEQLFLWDGAQADWKRYLALDATSGWAREAETRLRQIEERKKAWRDGLRDHELQPAEFLAAAARSRDLPLEPYLERAVKEWIPRMLEPGSSPEPGTAVPRLAALAAERHSDRWLSDLLRGSGHRAFRTAMASLSGAIRANGEGRRDRGGELATEAERLFGLAGNTAGSLRARIEFVYSLSRTFRSAACIEESRGLAARLLELEYRWAYGQLQLERFSCIVRTGNLGEAQVVLDDAIDHIRNAGYSTLLLRGFGFASNLQQVLGRFGEANLRDQEGLRLFWKGSHPPLRAHQFYANMSQAAERERRWELGYLASQEAATMIEMAGVPTTAAMARYRVALFAGVTQRASHALSEISRAEEALDRIKHESGTATLRAENQLQLAASYLDTGQIGLSERVLDRVRLADLQGNVLFRLTYHRTKGTAALRQNRLADGHGELVTALGLTNTAMADMRTERDRAHWKREAGSVYRQLVRLALDSDRDPELALALWERFRSAPIRGFDKSQRTSATAEEIRQLAARHRSSSVLAYAELEDTVAGWFYDDRGIHPFRSPVKASVVAAMCVGLQRKVARRGSSISEIRSQSRQLFDALIGPVERYLDPRRLLLVEPDGPCSGIPFEILLDAQATYLIDRVALATSPGAHAERALRSLSRRIT
jgi:tetratricopeptide (TPR) repeat protein